MNPRILPLLALASATVLASPSAPPVDPAVELDRAYQKLHETSYRMRATPLGIAASGGAGPTVTEYAGNRSRAIVETDVPSIGRVRQERVTIGGRSAVRTLASGAVTEVQQEQRRTRGRAARAWLGQAVSVGSNLGMVPGGRSSTIQSVVGAAVVAKSVADAHAVLSENTTSHDSSWRIVPAVEADSTPAALAGKWRNDRVERKPGRSRKKIVYECRPADGSDALTVVTVSAATGLPTREEAYLAGRKIARIDYFDVGEPITIEVPDCLKS